MNDFIAAPGRRTGLLILRISEEHEKKNGLEAAEPAAQKERGL